MVQIIDISPFTSSPPGTAAEQADVVTAWATSMETVGFAVIVGHGVETPVIDGMRAAALDFFAQPPETKNQYNHGAYGNPQGGYTAMGIESVARSTGESNAPPDPVENFVLRGDPALWATQHPPALAQAATTYHNALAHLLSQIHTISARALDLADGYFEPFYAGSSTGATIRLAHYPPLPRNHPPAQLRYGEHTDYQGFTLLQQDPGDGEGGLEVLLPTGEWRAIAPIPNSFVINIGDLWEVWTNGRWRSTKHRVANPPPGSAALGRARLSIPFFTGPRDDAVIEALPSCVSELNPSRYPRTTASDHLQMKLKATNV